MASAAGPQLSLWGVANSAGAWLPRERLPAIGGTSHRPRLPGRRSTYPKPAWGNYAKARPPSGPDWTPSLPLQSRKPAGAPGGGGGTLRVSRGRRLRRGRAAAGSRPLPARRGRGAVSSSRGTSGAACRSPIPETRLLSRDPHPRGLGALFDRAAGRSGRGFESPAPGGPGWAGCLQAASGPRAWPSPWRPRGDGTFGCRLALQCSATGELSFFSSFFPFCFARSHRWGSLPLGARRTDCRGTTGQSPSDP